MGNKECKRGALCGAFAPDSASPGQRPISAKISMERAIHVSPFDAKCPGGAKVT